MSSRCLAGIQHLERDGGDETMEGKRTGRVAKKQVNRQNMPTVPFPPAETSHLWWERERDREEGGRERIGGHV